MRLTRRSFCQAAMASSGLMMAGVSAAQPVTSAMEVRPGKAAAPAVGQWVSTACQGCTQWCAIQVFVQDGRAVKVRGNPHSLASGGNVCSKAHLIPQQTYDPDRIKGPMKRTNPEKGRGVDPKFVPISWDEALDIVAEKMMELRRDNETHKLTYLRGRYSSTSNELLYGTLPKMFGSPNNISHSAICSEADKMGSGMTQGFYGYRDYDLANTECLVVWGADPLSSNRLLPHASARFGDILARGTVITVDPRLSTAGAKSHEWLPIKPGTDGALAGAIAHVLLTEGLWNREFVGDFTDGQNRFVAGQAVNEEDFTEAETHGVVRWWNLELKDRTPEWAAAETLIPADQIIRVARAMGAAAPKVSVWMGPGVGMSPRGTYASMAVYALNGLVGSVDSEGGPLEWSKPPLAKFPKFDDYIDEVAKAGKKHKKIDGRGAKDMPAMKAGKPGSGVVTNNTANMMLKDPGAVKVLLSSWTNFAFSAQDTKRWEQALAAVPFFVHMVTNASEMTQFADVVLPSTLNTTEGLSIIANNANRYGYATIQQPTGKRLWDVRQEETEVVWLLAEKLKEKGWSNLYDYYATEFKDPETGQTPTNYSEFAMIAARMSSAPIWQDGGAAKGDKIDGWDAFVERGVYNTDQYQFKRLWGGNFHTVSKKFEFYSETIKEGLTKHAHKHETDVDDILASSGYLARGELAFVPHYEPPKRHGDIAEYPFEIIDYKSRLNREGRSANLPWYQEFKKLDAGDVSWGDVLKMHPSDGARLGLKNGDMVRVSSVAGAIEVKLKLWEGVRPGTVAKCFGQGHWAYGRVATADYANAKPRGSNINDILVDDYDRLTGSSARNGGFTGVKIELA